MVVGAHTERCKAAKFNLRGNWRTLSGLTKQVFYQGDYVVLNPLQGWILGLKGFFEGGNRRKFPQSVIFKGMYINNLVLNLDLPEESS